jgi:hypothetical protein
VEGRQVFKLAVTRMPEVTTTLLAEHGYGLADLDLLVMHQANLRINEAAQKVLGLPDAKVHNNIQRYGNTTSATLPLAFHEARQAGKARQLLVAFAALGAGLHWGAVPRGLEATERIRGVVEASAEPPSRCSRSPSWCEWAPSLVRTGALGFGDARAPATARVLARPLPRQNLLLQGAGIPLLLPRCPLPAKPRHLDQARSRLRRHRRRRAARALALAFNAGRQWRSRCWWRALPLVRGPGPHSRQPLAMFLECSLVLLLRAARTRSRSPRSGAAPRSPLRRSCAGVSRLLARVDRVSRPARVRPPDVSSQAPLRLHSGPRAVDGAVDPVRGARAINDAAASISGGARIAAGSAARQSDSAAFRAARRFELETTRRAIAAAGLLEMRPPELSAGSGAKAGSGWRAARCGSFGCWRATCSRSGSRG